MFWVVLVLVFIIGSIILSAKSEIKAENKINAFKERNKKIIQRNRELEKQVAAIQEQQSMQGATAAEPTNISVDSTTEHDKGKMFEDFIISLKPEYMKFLHRCSDYYDNGTYPEDNMEPDLLFSVNYYGEEIKFAVECKYRSGFDENGYIKWSYPAQLERYQQYEKRTGNLVFVAIGVDGNPELPLELFIVPLKYLPRHFAPRRTLAKFLRPQTDRKLSFSGKYRTLR